MFRKAEKQLLTWKDKRRRKPLILKGARQVGKTWLMKAFGEACFDRVAYINFDNNSRMEAVFDVDFNIDRLLMALEAESDTKIEMGKTLIIFDEVQEVPKAITSLKYFYENSPGYHIIAAGSLLGVAIFEGLSFPVGNVEFMDLYPMDFEEFLMAMGKERMAQWIESGELSLMDDFKSIYTDMLRKYYYVGGMPEAVEEFKETGSFEEVRQIQEEILEAYERDFSKHAPTSAVPKIRMIYHSLPSQLAKEHKKFVYGNMKKGARAREYEIGIDWLKDNGLILKVHRISKPGMPLSHYEDLKAFKLYMHDVGLLAAKSQVSYKAIIEGNEVFTEFKGALTEQFVLQQMVAGGMKSIYYWTSDRSSNKVDFVLQLEDKILPIEVKAEENLNAKSLRVFREKYGLGRAARISMSGYREEAWLTNLPLYGIHEASLDLIANTDIEG